MKRHLLIAAVFLLAGAVVNVAVAWGCATYVDITNSSSVEAGGSSTWHLIQRRVVGASRVLVFHRGADVNVLYETRDGMKALVGLTAFDGGGNSLAKLFPSPLRARPSWLSIDPSTARVPDVVAIEIDDARGWPMLAVRCRIVPQRPMWRTIENVQDGLKLPPRQGIHPWLGFRAVPLRPIWPGFSINTIIYATTLWLLACSLLAFRRVIRVRRGLCPACAYPRGESDVCSECGKALTGSPGHPIVRARVHRQLLSRARTGCTVAPGVGRKIIRIILSSLSP